MIAVCFDSDAWPAPSLIDNNSAVDCSILVKFGTEFDHVIANTLKTFKVRWSNFNTNEQSTDELLKTEQIFPARFRERLLQFIEDGAVSYTHLTLPTKRIV